MPVSAAVEAEIDQLQRQQALITDALRAMLEGTWTGPASVAAFLLALNPTFHLAPRPPDYTLPPQDHVITWQANTPQPLQQTVWSCSACALAWVLRATGRNPAATEASAIQEIGSPSHINAAVGLTDSSGPALRAVYQQYGFATKQAWLTFDDVWALAGETTGQISGVAWYHWVALRGHLGADLWIANSAPGYEGIHDRLSRSDFNRLGPFSVVWLTA